MPRKLVFLFLVALASSGWSADNKFTLLGKWSLNTMFIQNFVLFPNTTIGSDVHPFVSMLMPRVSDDLVARVDYIEFIDSELATLTTSKGTTKAFYSIGMSDFELGGSITFKLPNLAVFPVSELMFHCFSLDGTVFRFSYLTYYRSSFSPFKLVEVNLLGEMKRK